uniref:Interleukin-1 beta n=1 Tax=Hucho hucho TaxID=62062 RepID=A0A4W5JLJ4_9TELE
MVLRAVTLRGARFNLSMYNINMKNSHTIQAQPVALGIASSDFNLSCYKQTDNTSPILRLVFLTTTGISLTTFESAKYPGWFISTSLEQRQPVAMCQKKDPIKRTTFCVNNQTHNTHPVPRVYVPSTARERVQTDGYCKGVELIDPSTTALFGCPHRRTLSGSR